MSTWITVAKDIQMMMGDVYSVLPKLWKEVTPDQNRESGLAVEDLSVRHSVAAEKPSVEGNSQGSWIVESLKAVFCVCICKITPINPFIRSRTRYFRHAYQPPPPPPTRDNVILVHSHWLSFCYSPQCRNILVVVKQWHDVEILPTSLCVMRCLRAPSNRNRAWQ
jgi:hypothetical protein